MNNVRIVLYLKEEASRPCSTHAEENPVLTSEKQMQEEAADSETISCPVEQTSLKFEDNQCCGEPTYSM